MCVATIWWWIKMYIINFANVDCVLNTIDKLSMVICLLNASATMTVDQRAPAAPTPQVRWISDLQPDLSLTSLRQEGWVVGRHSLLLRCQDTSSWVWLFIVHRRCGHTALYCVRRMEEWAEQNFYKSRAPPAPQPMNLLPISSVGTLS